jgi:hypothetical protein
MSRIPGPFRDAAGRLQRHGSAAGDRNELTAARDARASRRYAGPGSGSLTEAERSALAIMIVLSAGAIILLGLAALNGLDLTYYAA